MLNHELDVNISDEIINKIDIQKDHHKLTFFYKIAQLYKLKHLAKATLSFMQSCFTISIENNNFLYPESVVKRTDPKAVSLEKQVFLLGGTEEYDTTWIRSVEKFSFATRAWSKVADTRERRERYCACAYKGKIILIGGIMFATVEFAGGIFNKPYSTDSCLEFDAESHEWRDFPSMREERSVAACGVFGGDLIVCGGFAGVDENFGILKSVESFNRESNKWSPMPSMNEGKYYHSLVVAKNKMFVIGNGKSRFEVFDKNFKKFVILKSPEIPTDLFASVKTTSFGNKIVVVGKNSSVAYCYDINEGEWSSMSFGYSGYLFTS